MTTRPRPPTRDEAITEALAHTRLGARVQGRYGAAVSFKPDIVVTDADVTALDAQLRTAGWTVTERRHAGSAVTGVTVAPFAPPA